MNPFLRTVCCLSSTVGLVLNLSANSAISPITATPANFTWSFETQTLTEDGIESDHFLLTGGEGLNFLGTYPPTSLKYETSSDNSSFNAESIHGDKFRATIAFYELSKIASFIDISGIINYERILIQNVQKARGLEYMPSSAEEGSNKYIPPHRFRKYSLPNGDTIKTDLGPKYFPFGQRKVHRIQYSLIDKTSEDDKGETKTIFYDEYLLKIDSKYGARMSFSSTSEKTMKALREKILSWLSSLSRT